MRIYATLSDIRQRACNQLTEPYCELGLGVASPRSLCATKKASLGFHMAGPCISILTPNFLSNSDEDTIRNYLNSISNTLEGNDFWISGQPFLVGFEKVDEDEKELDLNGWNPKASIYYCAMCNNQASHVLLATIAIKTAELMKGMIKLEGLTTLTKSVTVLTMSGHIKINDFDYIVEPGFLSYWLGEPDFRLLK